MSDNESFLSCATDVTSSEEESSSDEDPFKTTVDVGSILYLYSYTKFY